MSISYLNPTAHSLIFILSKAFGMGVEPGKAALKFTEEPLGDITASIEIISNRFHASLAIAFNEQSILSLTQNIINETHLEINDTVEHITSDIAVMIGGEAKRRFTEQGHEVVLKHPKVHVGYHNKILHPIQGPKIVFPINTEDGIVFLEICIEEKNERPQAGRSLFRPRVAA